MSGSAAAFDVPRVFVSHSHEDDQYCRHFVAELRRLLGSADTVWYDEHNLGSGELLTEIQRQLHARPIFIVVLSKAALHRSTWVADECRWAFQLRQREAARVILPVIGAPIESGDFYPDWIYLEGFKRIEAPGMEPFPAEEAARRTHNAIAPAHTSATLSTLVETPSKPEPASSAPQQPVPTPANTLQPHIRRLELQGILTPADLQPELFPERMHRLGFTAWTAKDPGTGESTALILPPLCRVPAGRFLMGSDPRHDRQMNDDEQPQHQVTLPEYQIGRFPVTQAEYACFVSAGHAKPAVWYTGKIKPDHPICFLDWKDARDYAAWLQKLTRLPWRVPSEAQWEKAARWDAKGDGGRGVARIYPWGDRFDAARCNTSESEIHGTTAVGTYGPEDPPRDGSSPCGAQDMAGNVWEWTRTPWDEHAYSKQGSQDDDESNENTLRVLRGGSSADDSGWARAASRYHNFPRELGSYVYTNYGFRLCL